MRPNVPSVFAWHKYARFVDEGIRVLAEHARKHAGERGGALLRVVYGGVENYGLAGGMS